MAAGLNFAVKAITLLPRTGVIGGTRVLSKPIIWRALTKGAADGVAYGDATLTIDQQYQIIVDINQARLTSAAAVGGAIFLGTQLWFYEKLKMKQRILEAGLLLEEVKKTSLLLQESLATNNKQITLTQSARLEELGVSIVALNDGLPALDDILIPVADELFDVKNLLGIGEVADEIVKTGMLITEGVETVKAVETVKVLLPKVQSLYTAAEASAKAAGTATWLSRTSKGIGLATGKVLLIDTIIWGITLGIDLGLNLFMTEEEQSNLPLIGFLFEGAGWSPIGMALEWVIVNTVELFIGEETAQTLYEAFVAVIIAASQVPGIEEVFELILGFFVDEINGDLLVDLTFEMPDLMFNKMNLDLFKGLTRADPLVILEVFLYAIIIKVVFKQWVKPLFDYTRSSMKGVIA